MNQTKKSKIAHLSSVHARYDNRILYKQCASLQKHGWDVHLIVADGKGDEVFKGVKIIDVGEKGSFIYRLINVTRKVYRLAKRLEADVYQIHDPELLPFALKLHKAGKRVIYDVHEDYHTSIVQKKYLPPLVKNTFLKIYELLERKAKKRLTIILAEKYYIKRFPKGHLVLNYPIINDDESSFLEKPSTYTRSVSRNLLYTGNVTEDRGAFTQAILVDKIDNISITFIGKVSEALADKMTNAIEHKDLISFEGVGTYVPQTRIQKVYREQNWLAGLAIFPKTAHYEQKELTKFFEYMLNGLPIICSDFPAWRQFVEENQCGFAVDPNDYSQIEQAIRQLADNPELRKKMGENGKAKVLNELNWQTQEQALIDVYQSLSRE